MRHGSHPVARPQGGHGSGVQVDHPPNLRAGPEPPEHGQCPGGGAVGGGGVRAAGAEGGGGRGVVLPVVVPAQDQVGVRPAASGRGRGGLPLPARGPVRVRRAVRGAQTPAGGPVLCHPGCQRRVVRARGGGAARGGQRVGALRRRQVRGGRRQSRQAGGAGQTEGDPRTVGVAAAGDHGVRGGDGGHPVPGADLAGRGRRPPHDRPGGHQTQAGQELDPAGNVGRGGRGGGRSGDPARLGQVFDHASRAGGGGLGRQDASGNGAVHASAQAAPGRGRGGGGRRGRGTGGRRKRPTR